MRPPLIPIAIVVAALYFDWAPVVGRGNWTWPVTEWQMYSKKKGTLPEVHYRRFVLLRDDGSTAPPPEGCPLPFLEHPYRIDSGVRRSLPRLLIEYLRVIRGNHCGDGVRGVIYERRRWRYTRRVLARAEAGAPMSAYLALEIASAPPPPPALGRRLYEVGFTLRELDRHTGLPRGTEPHDAWPGIGVDLAAANNALVLAPGPAPHVQWIDAAVPIEPGDLGKPLTIAAWVRADTPGASIGLVIDGIPTEAFAPDCPADGHWHRLSATLPLPAEHPPEPLIVRARLRADAIRSPVAFDDLAVELAP